MQSLSNLLICGANFCRQSLWQDVATLRTSRLDNRAVSEWPKLAKIVAYYRPNIYTRHAWVTWRKRRGDAAPLGTQQREPTWRGKNRQPRREFLRTSLTIYRHVWACLYVAPPMGIGYYATSTDMTKHPRSWSLEVGFDSVPGSTVAGVTVETSRVPSRHRENMLFEWGTTSAYHRSIHQNLSSATCSVSQMSVVVGYVILRFVVLRSMLDLTDVSISRDETSVVGGLDGVCWLHGSTNIVHCWWTKNTFDS